MTYTPPPANAPAVPQTQSLVSLVIGLASFLFGAIPFIGLLAFAGGIVAVVYGFRAKKNEPTAPPWMSLVGRIAGFAGMGLSVVAGLFWIATVIIPIVLPLWFVSTYNSL